MGEILGLAPIIWLIVILYFAGMLYMGWRSKKGIHDQEGFLLGNRQFGVPMMIMHAFGAGTHPGDVGGVTKDTVAQGASGIWVSWMWMFGTPFYWIIAPIIRRMRCLTLADYFEERFGKAAAALYVIVATVGMTIAVAGILLATTKTVQGMMGKAQTVGLAQTASGLADETTDADEAADSQTASGDGQITAGEADVWFFGILIVMSVVFIIYSYWGGIIAAIKTDMLQGLMIIALSFIAIPEALSRVGGLSGMQETIGGADGNLLELFSGKFSVLGVLLLCINAPFSMLAQPHLMSVCAAGKTEWEGRVGFTYGNILKRLCTMGWGILALCWLAHIMQENVAVDPNAAFGDAVRGLLWPVGQGLMLACIMAAAMSSGDALQVTIAGLFSQNVYKNYINPEADQRRLVHVTRITGVVIILSGIVVTIMMRADVVGPILAYFKLTACVGVASGMGILWRRMNSAGVFTSVILAVTAFIITKIGGYPQAVTTGIPLLSAFVGGVVGSLLTAPPRREVTDKFFKKIHTPIGQEDKLDLSLDEAVPESDRMLTAGGFFLVKPSFQSWFGFLLTLGICLAMLGTMYLLVTP